MKQVEGGVTAAKGFEAASTAAGIKYKDRTDMALVYYSQVPCVVAGTFTTNVVKAAPVKWDQQVVKSGAKAQAVVVNSGMPMHCTGAEGFGYCKDTADDNSQS
ncbi:MAG: bifunctional ornithine acetyltransferase/N-acetylglutamate synthase [Dorea longicatena]